MRKKVLDDHLDLQLGMNARKLNSSTMHVFATPLGKVQA